MNIMRAICTTLAGVLISCSREIETEKLDVPRKEQASVPHKVSVPVTGVNVQYELEQFRTVPAQGYDNTTAYIFLQIHGAMDERPTSTVLNCQFGMFRELQRLYASGKIAAVFNEAQIEGVEYKDELQLDGNYAYWQQLAHRIRTAPDALLLKEMDKVPNLGIDYFMIGYHDQPMLVTGWETKEDVLLEQDGLKLYQTERDYNTLERKISAGEIEPTPEMLELQRQRKSVLDQAHEKSKRRSLAAYDNSLEQFEAYRKTRPDVKGYAVIVGIRHFDLLPKSGMTLEDYVKSKEQHPQIEFIRCPE